MVLLSNAGRTLNFTVTTANSSPGRVIAFTRLSPGGQSFKLALAARSTLATDISRPLNVVGFPDAWARASDADNPTKRQPRRHEDKKRRIWRFFFALSSLRGCIC